MNMYHRPQLFHVPVQPEEMPPPRSMAQRSFVVAELYPESSNPPSHLRTSQIIRINDSKEDYATSAATTTKSFDTIMHQLEPHYLPEFYVLGRTTIRFDNDPDLPLILQRLCGFIKKCSMDFHVNENRVDCRVAVGPLLCFSIYLWRSPEPDSDDGTLIVELQRRQGCGVLMQRYRKALTLYLQSGTRFDPHELNRCTLSMPVLRSTSLTQSQPLPPVQRGTSDTLNQCRCMLESESDEQTLLAMENLAWMLNRNHSIAPETIHKVAHSIVWGKNNDNENKTCMLDELSSYLIGNQKQRKSHQSNEDACDFEALEFAQGHFCGVLHNLALQVLAGSLRVVVETTTIGPEHTALSSLPSPWPTVIRALCYNLMHAESRPQEAALSIQCLLLLDDLTLDHAVLETVLLQHDLRMIPCLLHAQQFGTTHNDLLSQQVCNLLERIQDII